MAEKLQNLCCWSSSRESTFFECKKKYWYTYYGAWEGWPLFSHDPRASVDPLALYLYRLKNMQTIPIFLGSLIHKVIEKNIRTIMRSKKLPLLDHVMDEAKQLLKQGLDDSQKKAYVKNPKQHVNLLEDYYERSKPSQDTLETKLFTCLSNWHASPIIQSTLLHPSTSLGGLEELMKFSIRPSMECIVVFDLSLYWKRNTSEEKLLIFDWKTGSESDRISKQMLAYALAATRLLQKKLSSITVCPFYLAKSPSAYEKIHLDQPTSEKEIQETENDIIHSLVAMKALHSEPILPDPKNFPYREDTKSCLYCPYQEMCKKAEYQDKTKEELHAMVV